MDSHEDSDGDYSDMEKVVAVIRKLAKYHCVVHAPSLRPSDFRKPCPDFDYDSPARFNDAKTTDLGPTAELYASVPIDFHDLMATTDSFGENVCPPF